jgi:hypothetical protein
MQDADPRSLTIENVSPRVLDQLRPELTADCDIIYFEPLIPWLGFDNWADLDHSHWHNDSQNGN